MQRLRVSTEHSLRRTRRRTAIKHRFFTVLGRARLSVGLPRHARPLSSVEHAHNRAKTDESGRAPAWNALCGCPVSRSGSRTVLPQSRSLRDAGGHVASGGLGLKTHAKLCPVVRREQDRLQVHLRDTVQTRYLLPDGSYERLTAQPGDTPLSSQAWLLQHWSRRPIVESSVAM